MALLVKLAKSANSFVSAREIQRVTKNAGGSRGVHSANFIYRLRKRMGDSNEEPGLIIMEGMKHYASYKLNAGSVEFVGESKYLQRGKEGREQRDVVLPDEQTVTIRGAKKALALEILVKSYGSESKSIRSQEFAVDVYGSYDNRSRSSISRLVAGLSADLNPVGWRTCQPVGLDQRRTGERAIYYLEKIASDGRQAEPAILLPTPTMKTPLVSLPPETKSVELPSTPTEASTELKDLAMPTEEEMLLFVTQAKRRSELFKSYGLEPLPKEIVKAWARPSAFRREAKERSKEQIDALKLSVYEKLVKIIDSDEIYTIPEQFSDRARKLIEYFIDLKKEDKLELLRKVLFEEKNSHYKVDKFGHVEGVVKVKASENRAEDAASQKKIEEVEESQGKITKSPDLAEQFDTSYKGIIQESEKQKGSAIERHFPDIKNMVAEVVGEVEPHLTSKTKTLTVPQISRAFKIKAKFIQKATKDGYVAPIQGRDHHPIFNLEEIARIILFKKNGNGLSPVEARELKKIIAEEVERRINKEAGSK